MEYIVIFCLVILFNHILIKWLIDAFKDEKKHFSSTGLQDDLEHSTEKVINSMLAYWKLRVDNARSIDEGADCLLKANKSEQFFRKQVADSLGILTAREIEQKAVQKATNVVPLKRE